MIVRCGRCGRRFVAAEDERAIPAEDAVCPGCLKAEADTEAPPAPEEAPRWVSPAPIQGMIRRTPPVQPIMPASPTPTAPDEPAVEPPATVPVHVAPRRLPGRVAAVAAALVVNGLLLGAIGPVSTGAARGRSEAVLLGLGSPPRVLLPDAAEPVLATEDGPAPPAASDDRQDDALQRTSFAMPVGRVPSRLLAMGGDASALVGLPAASLPVAAGAPGSPLSLPSSSLGEDGPTLARFMGIEASGRRFCIIADRSGSMRFGGKLERLKDEILKTVGELKGSARFTVILYNYEALPIPAGRWLGGDRDDVPRTAEWLSGVNPVGATNPVPAFQAAFRMNPKPDVIFFMTDGLFPPIVAPAVASLNNGRRKVPIHTIAFLDREAEGLLKTISAQSGGTYRYVPGF